MVKIESDHPVEREWRRFPIVAPLVKSINDPLKAARSDDQDDLDRKFRPACEER
jgi:hypothetical protein